MHHQHAHLQQVGNSFLTPAFSSTDDRTQELTGMQYQQPWRHFGQIKVTEAKKDSNKKDLHQIGQIYIVFDIFTQAPLFFSSNSYKMEP